MRSPGPFPVLSILVLVSCSSDPGAIRKGPGALAPGEEESGSPDGSGDTESGDSAGDSPAPDADGDGHTRSTDCDDADPDVHPEAEERCNGVDEDCDGAVDEGIPSDGAGCQDPGLPAFPEAVGVVHVTVRTGDGTYDGTDDGMELCLGTERCLSFNKPAWDDLQPGVHDVIIHEGPGWSRSDLSGFTVRTSGGENLWRPACFEVRLDGEPVYCRDDVAWQIGSEAGETPSWTDPDGWANTCTTCFDSPLTHGPVVGAVAEDRAIIWLRSDATRAVRLRVADRSEALVDAEPVAHRYPSAERDFAEQIQVFGLQPGTSYHYDIEIEGVRHGPWSFTTPPAKGSPTRLSLGFGSCTRDDDQPLFGVIAAHDPDLFLFIGDNHYGNTADLSALRQHYRWALERPLRSELLRGRSILATWDDHDYTGNNTDGTAAGKETALRVFSEYQPNGSYGTESTPGVFSQHSWGDVDIFLLDDRYWKGLDDSLLGDAQESWLLDALSASTATFKLLASGSQWTGSGSSDSWAAFPEASARFQQALVDRHIEGVVLLSGDIHRSELRLLPGAPGGYPLPELTSSPMANSNSGCGGTGGELRSCVNDSDFFILVETDSTLADPTLRARIIDASGAERADWTILRSSLSL